MQLSSSLDYTLPTLSAARFGPVQDSNEHATRFIGFIQTLQKQWRNLVSVINGNIGFGDGVHADNVNGVWASVNFPLANTDVTVTHNLGRLPVGYIVMTKSQAGDVYTGSVVATKTQITLRCSTAGTTVSLFIV